MKQQINITKQRLSSQLLSNAILKTPAEVVHRMGAVQAQDFAGAKWALGLRLHHLDEKSIEDAFNRGEILRTHVLRPTWHFVTPSDIRWMIELTAPNVLALGAYNFRKLELDKRTFSKSNKVLAKILSENEHLERGDIKSALENAKINTDELRFVHLLFKAELDLVICSGPRVGKQLTYSLLERRAPHAKTLARPEALYELAKRYFTSHGPATVQDYMWWSGLSQKDAKEGIGSAASELKCIQVNDREYFSAGLSESKSRTQTYLLPAYDEYTVGYQDRSLFLEPRYNARAGNGIFKPVVLIDGQIAGTWSRNLKKDSVQVSVKTFSKVPESQKRSISTAVKRYEKFLAL
jgi:hypothetical protein